MSREFLLGEMLHETGDRFRCDAHEGRFHVDIRLIQNLLETAIHLSSASEDSRQVLALFSDIPRNATQLNACPLLPSGG